MRQLVMRVAPLIDMLREAVEVERRGGGQGLGRVLNDMGNGPLDDVKNVEFYAKNVNFDTVILHTWLFFIFSITFEPGLYGPMVKTLGFDPRCPVR